ncbi:MAG: ligase-associated DNA damage response endonuclease PdeM [Bacteroidota bacterium]|nr:ligase-associated DNA damage response endonuclease PdeM [Bacteroidota bacterium]
MINIHKNSIDVIINDEVFTLLPQKAIYYKKEKAIIVTDIHLGKTGHFRNAGIPVPADLAFVDLEILDDLLNDINLKIERLIVLGDLFHSKLNIDWRIFEEWRIKNRHIKIQLIKGNHDILSDEVYRTLNIEVFDLAIMNKFMLVHKYKDEDQINGLYKICGHIHPAVRIYGKARQALTLPCFYFGESFGILPAFGRFTGKYIIRPCENDSVFVIADMEEGKKVMRV